MLEANIPVVEARALEAAEQLRGVARKMHGYRQAKRILGNLTNAQKVAFVESLDLDAVQAAYDAAVAAYTSNEPL